MGILTGKKIKAHVHLILKDHILRADTYLYLLYQPMMLWKKPKDSIATSMIPK